MGNKKQDEKAREFEERSLVLSESEALTERLLAEKARRVQARIIALQQAHIDDVKLFLKGVEQRSGMKIPLDVQTKKNEDGSVSLVWKVEKKKEVEGA